VSERFVNKTAIVTGAGSTGPGWGNGKAAAVLYAREGANVVAVDIDRAAAEETASIIREEGGEVTVHVADVGQSDLVAALIEETILAYGQIDVLHNNVGIVEVGGPLEISEDNWDRLIAINLKSIFLTCKYALPHMLAAGRGAIVNISSIASIRHVGFPSISYCASKGGVNQLTQNIAVQYASQGIRANCVLPGLIDTPLIRASIVDAYGGDPQEMVRQRDKLCPSGRMGTAWEVAHASLFLASDEASYITGHQLVVDGGLTCKVG
jgi:NAD(P)-dependent dehydrogenase (short-subunit alcohol dehydrogenase family)